jgi:hypothetical protein
MNSFNNNDPLKNYSFGVQGNAQPAAVQQRFTQVEQNSSRMNDAFGALSQYAKSWRPQASAPGAMGTGAGSMTPSGPARELGPNPTSPNPTPQPPNSMGLQSQSKSLGAGVRNPDDAGSGGTGNPAPPNPQPNPQPPPTTPPPGDTGNKPPFGGGGGLTNGYDPNDPTKGNNDQGAADQLPPNNNVDPNLVGMNGVQMQQYDYYKSVGGKASPGDFLKHQAQAEQWAAAGGPEYEWLRTNPIVIERYHEEMARARAAGFTNINFTDWARENGYPSPIDRGTSDAYRRWRASQNATPPPGDATPPPANDNPAPPANDNPPPQWTPGNDYPDLQDRKELDALKEASRRQAELALMNRERDIRSKAGFAGMNRSGAMDSALAGAGMQAETALQGQFAQLEHASWNAQLERDLKWVISQAGNDTTKQVATIQAAAQRYAAEVQAQAVRDGLSSQEAIERGRLAQARYEADLRHQMGLAGLDVQREGNMMNFTQGQQQQVYDWIKFILGLDPSTQLGDIQFPSGNIIVSS